MPLLRQSTAVSVIIGPFLSDTSGVTLMTSIEVSTATGVDVYKGATKTDITTTVAGTNAMAHVANGMYSLAFVASQMNNLGVFAINANFPSCLPVWHFYDIIEETEWDRVFGTGATVADVKVDTTSIAISVASILANVNVWGTSIMVGIASLVSSTSAIYDVVDDNNNRLEALRIDNVSIGANVNKWGTSTMIGIASLLVNVGIVDTVVDSIKVETASILSTLDTAQIDLTSLVVSVDALQADHVSLMTDVDAILANYAQASLLATVDTVVDSIQIDVTSILTNYSQASLLATVDTVVDGIQIDVTSILANISGFAQASLLATVDTVVDAIKIDTASIISAVGSIASVPSAIAALNDLSAADVNAEVLDVLNVDTFGEIGQTAPSSVATLADKLGFLYKEKRNKKSVTSTAINIYSADDVTVDQVALHSDSGSTYDRAKVGSGP